MSPDKTPTKGLSLLRKGARSDTSRDLIKHVNRLEKDLEESERALVHLQSLMQRRRELVRNLVNAAMAYMDSKGQDHKDRLNQAIKAVRDMS